MFARSFVVARCAVRFEVSFFLPVGGDRLKIRARSNQRSRVTMRARACLTGFRFFRPRRIILARSLALSLLRCSLQSLGEYLKRPDQSAPGQFHQHLNTCLLFLREQVYLLPSLSSPPPFSLSLSFSLFLAFAAFLDLPKQPPGLWISLRGRPAGEKSREKRDAARAETRDGREVFKSVG